MPLGIYKLTDGQAAFSNDHTFSNPILWESSTGGGVLEQRVYLRMEDANTQYLTEGRLFAIDSSGIDESGWFSFAPDEGGGPGTYESEFLFEIPLGSEIPVWIRVEIPEALEEEPKDDIRISATWLEHIEV